MSTDNPIHLPFTEPVIVFTLLITIILLAPILFKKLHVPGIVGLLVSGMVIGPNGLNLVEFGESIKLLGMAGLLYLMFLAGLELNSRELKRNLKKSLTFGALTFFIPLVLGFVVAYFWLAYNLLASLLIASMFSTHTLIAYPIASRLGITRSESVTITIGGTIITDTAVLLLLAFISAFSTGTVGFLFWLRMIVSIFAFSFLVLWGVPKVSNWFLKNLEGESGSQYIFILAMLFISGLLARMAGIEPIIGAFLAGLALSNLIPSTSALMNRISFIGNNLFIPIFLISVGLMVDLSVFFKGSGAIVFAIVLVIIAISSKFLAAWLMQAFYKYSNTERQVIFGLSVSHAAAIIAVVIVGYNLKLIGLEVLNGAIMIILVSCLVGSFVTERAGRRLAMKGTERMEIKVDQEEKILVSVANPNTIEGLIDFAILVREKPTKDPMFMLSVIPDDEFAREAIAKGKNVYDSAISHAAAAEVDLRHITRVDLNVAYGISRAIKEMTITKIVLGWNGKTTTTNLVFGSIIEKLIDSTDQMTLVVKTLKPINTTNRIVVIVPNNADCETGFADWLNTVKTLAKNMSSPLVFCGPEKTLKSIQSDLFLNREELAIDYQEVKNNHPFEHRIAVVNEDDFFVVIAARRRTLSYSHYFEQMPRDLARNYEKNNFIIIYPAQRTIETPVLSSALDGLEATPIPEKFERFINIGNNWKKSSDTRHNSATE